MKKATKKFLSVVLCFMLVLGIMPLAMQGVKAETASKKITDYSVGDTFEFGYYPQSKVTDNATITALNELAKVDNTSAETIKTSTSVANGWTSYGYYSGTGDEYDGKMTASDYMRYTDIVYNGNKYRGVIFDSYRPYYTGYTSSDTYQDDNGYNTSTVYWFKFEPIKWRVLDPSTGMVMSETILDSQAFSNYILSANDEYYGDANKTYYANNYAESSIREWLNKDFYNTAFSASHKAKIVTTTLNNSAYSTDYSKYDSATTNDNIYLLSYTDSLNTSYGFSSSTNSSTTRTAQGSDYAKSQGLWVSTSSSYSGNSYWRLRSAGGYSGTTCGVGYDGLVGYYCSADGTDNGVRPAMNFKTDVEIVQYPVTSIAYYQTGDTFEFGWYPQSKVTDDTTIAALNAEAGVDSENIATSTSVANGWTSYDYYSGTGEQKDGQMTAGDWMRYTDVVYGYNKYRGVVFDSYRPSSTGYNSSSTYQDDNGYSTETVYWFKYEPITWRVLDPATGLVMSETILDSQAFNNYILSANDEYYGDPDKEYYATDYAESSIRQWLTNDFYNTAFSASQKDMIATTELDNSAYDTKYSEYNSATTNDKIYLLSYAQAMNTSYGFSSSNSDSDTRTAQGSDYAKSQGLYIYNGNSYWRLRSAGSGSKYSCLVFSGGYVSYNFFPASTDIGIRPALNLNPTAAITQSDVSDTGYADYTVETYTMNTNGTYEKSEQTKSAMISAKVTAGYKVPSGFILNSEKSVLSGSVKANGSLVLKKYLDRKKYTLKTVIDETENETEYYFGQTISAKDPTKPGYNFTGWSPEIPATMPANALTVTAQFEAKDGYTVAFDTDSGSEITAKANIKWTDKVLDGVTDPTNAGFNFKGWKYGTTDVTSATEYKDLVQDDAVMTVTLVAKWENKGANTLRLNGNGGTQNNTATEDHYTNAISINAKANPFEYPGYTFVEWNTMPDGSGTSYNVGATVNFTVAHNLETIELYAIWSENSDYTVAFNTDGGSEINAKANVKWSDKVLDGISNPTKQGYTFTGWYNGIDKVTAETTYASLVANDKVMSVELKALWVEKSDYTVAFDTNGGSEINAKTGVKWTDKVLENVSAPEKSGFSFDGWFVGDNAVSEDAKYCDLVSSDTVKSITLTAKLTDIESPVISGLENGTAYCDGKTFTVSDNVGIKSVTANGTPLTETNGEYVLEAADGEVAVVVTDLEGNTASVTVTVNEHNYENGECTECGAKDEAECWLIRFFRSIINWFVSVVNAVVNWFKLLFVK